MENETNHPPPLLSPVLNLNLKSQHALEFLPLSHAHTLLLVFCFHPFFPRLSLYLLPTTAVGAMRREQPCRRVQGLHALQEGGRGVSLRDLPSLGTQVIKDKRGWEGFVPSDILPLAHCLDRGLARSPRASGARFRLFYCIFAYFQVFFPPPLG